MFKLPKFSYGVEWIQCSQKDIVIQISSIDISRHEDYREFSTNEKKMLVMKTNNFNISSYEELTSSINIDHKKYPQHTKKLNEAKKNKNVFGNQD